MNALLYLTKRSFINQLKKAVRKPATLLLLVFVAAYAVLVLFSLGMAAAAVRFDSVRGLTAVVTFWTLYIFLADFIGYASRKGVLFRPGHAHFVFPSPISPKLVLINSAWMNYLMSVGVSLVFSIGALTVFGVPAARAVLFFFAGTTLEIAFEISVIILLYTNERVSAWTMQKACFCLKVLLVLLTAGIVWYFIRNGLSAASVMRFVDHPLLQAIPGVGWNIAFYRLILLGPQGANVISSILYLVMTAAAVLAARRMKCEGAYYEDAAKFADDYAEMRQQKKSGEIVMGIGKKKKFRQVSVKYRASGAKAVFYRQMLEYRKERFYIFNSMTVFCAVFSLAFGKSMQGEAVSSGVPQLFLLGLVAYMTLVLGGYLGKWDKELKSPYLYLIPDSAVKKLWYATLIEHIKALADGCFLCIPAGILWGIRPGFLVFSILIFTILQANKLYTRVLAQCLAGDVLGRKGQEFLRILMQMFLLGIGITLAAAAGILIRIDLIFPLILIYSIAVTILLGLLASIRFDRMEQM